MTKTLTAYATRIGMAFASGMAVMTMAFPGTAYAPPCPSGDTERCTIGNFAKGATLDITQVNSGTDCPILFWDNEAGEFWCETEPGTWLPPVNWDGTTMTTPFDCEETVTYDYDDSLRQTFAFCDG